MSGSADKTRLSVLDGWRGISIVCVLATHMLPLGPRGWGNSFVGVAGMSLFFTLSGFLIASTLLERMDVRQFFIRRACRILPLAFIYPIIALALQGKDPLYYLSHFLFLINYDHAHITGVTSHFWSLCVEVHFYVFIGLLIAMAGRRGFVLLPPLCVAITLTRVFDGAYVSIVTHLRVDEILAGSCLALVYHDCMGGHVKRVLSRMNQALLVLLLVLACYPGMGPMQYLRPYMAAALVGSTLFRPENVLHRALSGGFLRYIATVSYALYVWHKLTMFGWLGTGGTFERYLLKRPISFALTFGLAHLSTFYYEKWWIDVGKRLTLAGRPTRQIANLVRTASTPCCLSVTNGPELSAARASVEHDHVVTPAGRGANTPSVRS